jgi:hypothetical protein
MGEVPLYDCLPTAVEMGENNLNGCQDFRTGDGSSQCQNLALTGLFFPSSLDSGVPAMT